MAPGARSKFGAQCSKLRSFGRKSAVEESTVCINLYKQFTHMLPTGQLSVRIQCDRLARKLTHNGMKT